MDILLGFVAAIIVAWFSRQREFRADAGAAAHDGQQPAHACNALARLGGMHARRNAQNMAAMGIAGGIGNCSPPTRRLKSALPPCSPGASDRYVTVQIQTLLAL